MNLDFVRTALLTGDPAPHAWRELCAWLVEEEERDRGRLVADLRDQVADLECELGHAEDRAEEDDDRIRELEEKVEDLEKELDELKRGAAT